MADDGLTTFLILGVAAGGGLALLNRQGRGSPPAEPPATRRDDRGDPVTVTPSPEPSRPDDTSRRSGQVIGRTGGKLRFSKGELSQVSGGDPDFDAIILNVIGEGPGCGSGADAGFVHGEPSCPLSRCFCVGAEWRGQTFRQIGPGQERLVGATSDVLIDPLGRKWGGAGNPPQDLKLTTGTWKLQTTVQNQIFDEVGRYEATFQVGGVDREPNIVQTIDTVGVVTFSVFTDTTTDALAWWDGSRWRVDGERMTIELRTPTSNSECGTTLPILTYKRAKSNHAKRMKELGRKRNSKKTAETRARSLRQMMREMGLPCVEKFWRERRQLAEKRGEVVA